MNTGYLHLFRFRGMPIRMHWAVLVLTAYVVGENKYALAGMLGFLTIVLAHELGHAVLVRKYRLRVHEIRIHPFGGECIHEASSRPRTDSIIAWGGVLAQLALCAVAVSVLVLARPSNPWTETYLERLIIPNLIMAAFNLIPISPLDGHLAWRLFTRSRPRTRTRIAARVAQPTGSKPIAGKPSSSKPKAIVGPRVLTSAEQHELGALVDDALERAKTDSKANKDG